MAIKYGELCDVLQGNNVAAEKIISLNKENEKLKAQNLLQVKKHNILNKKLKTLPQSYQALKTGNDSFQRKNHLLVQQNSSMSVKRQSKKMVSGKKSSIEKLKENNLALQKKVKRLETHLDTQIETLDAQMLQEDPKTENEALKNKILLLEIDLEKLREKHYRLRIKCAILEGELQNVDSVSD